MAIFQFFLPPRKFIEVEVIFFSRAHQKKFMTFEHNLTKFHQNLKNFYSIKFYDAFVKVESEHFHNFINKKLVVSIFVTNIFERYEKVYYCIRKNFWALKAREATKWPRTFYMVLTVGQTFVK